MSPVLFSLFLLASDPSVATATTAADPAEQVAPVKKQKEKKICKTDPSYTGSRMSKQLCLTAAEWEKRKQGIGNTSQMGRSYTAN